MFRLSPGFSPVEFLLNKNERTLLGSEGLPILPFSLGNAAIIAHALRWQLLIDPHEQLVSWIARSTKRSDCKLDFVIVHSDADDLRQQLADAMRDGRWLVVYRTPSAPPVELLDALEEFRRAQVITNMLP